MIADGVLFAANNNLELQAFEFCLDNAVTIREAYNYDVYRFEDSSEVKVFINSEHEIIITP